MSDAMQAVGTESQEEQVELNQVHLATTTGSQLAASRQSKNWTIAFVADQLKLSQVQIVALEADNFSVLPKMVIVRGFVRAYAKLLKVDADSLIALLPKEMEPVQLEAALRPALSTPFVDSRLSLQGNHDNNRRYIVGAIVLVVIVGLFLVLQATEFGKNFRSLMESKPVVVGEHDASAPPLNESALENNTSEKVNVTKNLDAGIAQGVSIEPADKTNESLSASNAVVQPVVAPDAVESNSVSSAVPASLPPVDELFVLKFRQDSWVQVKTETGAILSSHLARAGTEESFSVKQSLFVKIGNAAGVDAVLRGTPMSVSSERGNNVANLVVK
jgi:cytoskeleton protein RodZ